MILQVSKIVHRVRVTLDEMGLNDAEFASTQDSRETDSLIRHKIREAARFVIDHADMKYLEPNTVMTSTNNADGMTIDSNLVGHLTLPETFLRLCYAKFDSWPLYVSDVVLWDDKAYAMFSNPHTTGTYERPKVALVMRPERQLELYSARAANEGWLVGIVTEVSPEVDDNDNTYFEFPEKLFTSLIYYIAGLVCVSWRDSAADNFFQLAMSNMGVIADEK